MASQNRQGHSLQVPGGEMTRAPGQRDDDSIDQGAGAGRSTSRVSPPQDGEKEKKVGSWKQSADATVGRADRDG